MGESGFPDWAQMTDRRREHVRRVVALLDEWAERGEVQPVERRRWRAAAYLHDAVKDAPAEWLRAHADDAWAMPALYHGPAAAKLAAEHGETDPGILNAVRYHSVGHDQWDRVGQMLYLADFLEPGRPSVRPWLGELREQVPEDPRTSLRRVATLRLGFLIEAGLPLLPETVSFWNWLWSDA